MNSSQLAKLSVTQLLERFIRLGLAQGEAADVVNTASYNRIVMQLVDIGDELRSRPGDRRNALAELFEHPNLQVRLSAATHLIAVMPSEARRQIELIANSKYYPTAGTAGTYLIMLDLHAKQAIL